MELYSVIIKLFASLFIFLCICSLVKSICPEKCICRKVSEDRNDLKVKCGGTPQNKIQTFKELDFRDDIENIVHLDLSKNQISFIEKIDFANYTNLKRLNLSYNSLKQIDELMFGEISTLERLDLSTNVIVHIHQGSFEKLKALKQLDISNNPLACDCDLLWLVTWSNNYSVKLKPTPKCETPKPFKGFALKKLRIGLDLHCESPLQPLLELRPDTNQLLFEGDVLVLKCRAPRVAVGPPNDSEDLPVRAHIFWGWSGKIYNPNSTEDIIYQDPTVHFPSIQIDAKHLSDSGLLDSILKIPYVTENHTGTWDCRLRSQQANLSQSISVLVISNKTKYCPAVDVHNNKGKYYWPRTVLGRVVRLPCAGETLPHPVATYKCDENGEWINLNTEPCPFISETTRVLEQFAKVNLSIAKGSVLESAKRLRNFTQSDDIVYKIRDAVDVEFIIRTLKNYLDFVNQEKDLGSMLLDIVSQIIILPSNLLQSIQTTDNSAIQLVDAVEQAAQYTSLSLTHKNHLAIEYFKVRIDSFNGLTCTWFRPVFKSKIRNFQCNTATQAIDIFKNYVDASVQIPQNFLSQQQQLFAEKLMVAVYENSNFFSTFVNQTSYTVTSVVIGVKLLTTDFKNSSTDRNLSDPISIMLRARPFHDKISFPIPVFWDIKTNSWSRKGCEFSYYFQGLVLFTCNKLGYYGLLQNKFYLNDFLDENAGARFRISPPGFYVGSIILFICIWINIVTYIVYGNSIQMARRQRHTLINTWLALSILVFIFGIGIFQTEDYRICQIFGLCIHYFSLCVLFWVCVNLSSMYKRLSKRFRVPVDELPKENLGKKPIMGIYLVGWGIGLLICGISSAVNIREYASYSYCFLKKGPALSAIFIPSTILLIFIFILFMCIRCHVKSGQDQNDHFSEETQATENVDLKLLETTNASHLNQRHERYRSLTLSSPSTSLQDDLEHTNVAQLKAYFIFLLLYIISWLTAAASIVSPFDEKFIYEEEVFSTIFAISSSILGLFLVFFYCISRSDVRRVWSELSCRHFCFNSCCRTRSISDSKELNTVTYHQTCETTNSGSRSTSQCSKTRTPTTANYLKPNVEINSSGALPVRTESPNKILTSPSNLVLVNPVIFTQEIPNADIFYNPNQINVARKFFKKQKRLAKRNNFELQRQLERTGDFGDGTSDVSSSTVSYPKTTSRGMSMFNGGSKVNNINIHVKSPLLDNGHFSKDAKQQNINILSDNCNESDLILAADNLRVLSMRNKVNNIDMVANIYTNVPETLRPQHEIVTMRADDKFRKSINVDELLEEDEISMEHNDLNSQSDRINMPLYVNDNIRNIINDYNEKNLDDKCTLELKSCDDKTNIDQLILSLNSPIALAMNTIGLPAVNKTVTSSKDSINVIDGDNFLDLDKNEAYISVPLEITDRIHQNECEPAIRINYQEVQKSKSVDNLDLQHKSNIKTQTRSFCEDPTRSISCGNLSQIDEKILCARVILSPSKTDLNSPVLFSPSLCEINDLPSPSDRRKPIILNDNDDLNGSFGQNSNSLLAQSMRYNFTSSPTCESDLNYQNSELSIRSHGVYAPQPDNDLNMTLTGEEHIYYSYQPSEISDNDVADDNDFNTGCNNCLLSSCHVTNDVDSHGSQSSIDELYQRITRRNYQHNSNNEIVESNSMLTSSNCENIQKGGENINENDDDSSQCSIISYIDPNECSKVENSGNYQ